MLPPMLHGGSSIYRFVPCDAATAFKLQPTNGYTTSTSMRIPMKPPGLSAEQRASIAELLVAAKRFWFASPGAPEQQASERLTAAFERFAKAIDE